MAVLEAERPSSSPPGTGQAPEHEQFRLYRRWWRMRAAFSSRLSESLLGIRVSKACAQEDREIGRFAEQNTTLREAGIQTAVTSQRLSTILNFINS